MESYPVRNLTQSEYFGGRKLARAWRKKQKLRTYAKKKKSNASMSQYYTSYYSD